MNDWKEEHSSKRPDSLEVIAPGIYMERKDIKEVTVPADENTGMGEYTEYVCKARRLTFEEYRNEQAMATARANAQIILNQVESEDNQTAMNKTLAQILLNQVSMESV